MPVNNFGGGKIMNKNEILNAIKEKSGVSKRDCKLCFDAMLDIIKDALTNGESVTISNFGKFKVNDNKSKNVYNFKTKNVEIVNAKKTPVFKASDSLKQCLK